MFKALQIQTNPASLTQLCLIFTINFNKRQKSAFSFNFWSKRKHYCWIFCVFRQAWKKIWLLFK